MYEEREEVDSSFIIKVIIVISKDYLIPQKKIGIKIELLQYRSRKEYTSYAHLYSYISHTLGKQEKHVPECFDVFRCLLGISILIIHCI